jgi:hypothetical protein
MCTGNFVSWYSDGMAGDVKLAVVVKISRFITRSFDRTWDQTPKKI